MTGDLTTLATVKQYLGQTQASEDDALLERLITAASTWFRSAVGDAVLLDAYSEPFVGDGIPARSLLHNPVTEVTKVMVGTVEVPKQVIATDQGYSLVNDRVQLWGYTFTKGSICVIDYMAGYDTVPADIEQAICELVGYRYRRRDTLGHMSKSVGGEVITFQPESGAMAAVNTVVEMYRRPRVA